MVTGNHLGDLASEIPSGYEIDEFVCAGPKQYGYRLRKISSQNEYEHVLKLRGFSLDYQASLVLNYETFKSQVKDFVQGYTQEKPIGVTYSHFIRPNIKTGTVISCPLTKYYKPVLTKGIVGSDFRVRNFGDVKKDN